MISNVPFTIGTYARILKPAGSQNELNLFSWTCFLHVTERPFLNTEAFIERVEFTLHKSFSNHIRNVSSPPFAISAEGWGEFPINIEVFTRLGGSVKLVHYLKLDSPKQVVVNETFEYLSFPGAIIDLDSLPMLPMSHIPVFSEYVAGHGLSDFLSCERSFIASNDGARSTQRDIVSKSVVRAIQLEVELFTLINNGK